MHDPMTVAFDIKSPFRGKPSQWSPKGYRETWITIWHVDPEADGTEDSCDWFGWKRPLSPEERAIFDALYNLETILDNRPFFPDHEAHARFQPLKDSIRQLCKRKGWRIHPRWHIWHWKIQIHPLQQLKRMLFSRCCKCGGWFKYGESCIGYSWNGRGPGWFRNRENIAHIRCDSPAQPGTSPVDVLAAPSQGEEKRDA